MAAVAQMTPGDDRDPEVRVDDGERDRFVEVLRAHCADGRLTLDEFSERVGEVFAARTRAELDATLRDLPRPAPPPPAARTEVADSYRRKPVGWTVGIMNGSKQTGRWRVAAETGAVAIMGGVVLDLRKAEIDEPTVTIHAVAIMGGIDIIVPEGIAVEMSGLNIMGAKDIRVSDAPILPGTPVVKVDAFVLMGSIVVRNKRPRVLGSKSSSGGDRHVQARVDERLDRMHERIERRTEHVQSHVERHEQKRRERMERMQREVDKHRDVIEREVARAREQWPRTESLIDAVASAVGIEPLRKHAAPDGTVTILFSDIEGSTLLLEQLGDRRWVEVLREHRAIVRGQLQAYNGFEVSSQGDGFMLAFSSARRALQCAIATQRAFEAYNTTHPDTMMMVRMGLHVGETVKEGDDFLGKAVHYAARIAAAADGGEILTSSLVKELTESSGEFHFTNGRVVQLKGLSNSGKLYSVEWDEPARS